MTSDSEYLASLEFFGIKLGLDQTRELFELLGNPQNRLRFIHIAGSNGKGSVCAFLEAAFRSAGFKTGFYCSPHLVTVNERFRVNGESVSDEVLSRALRRLREAGEFMAKKGRKITYFEATTALAAIIFQEAETEIVLWETGMGGRLDATNIVTPEASVITGISLEHTQYLGNTLEKIAWEKAGILKRGVPAFCSPAIPPAALRVIADRASELGSKLTIAPMPGPADRIENSFETGTFLQSFRLPGGESLSVSLPGSYQRLNASLAWTVLQNLAPGFGFPAKQAAQAFANVRWDARLQFFPKKNLILDGGHNPEALGLLAQSLRELFPGKKFHFLFGAFSDKETAPELAELADLALSFTFIPMDTLRAARKPEELASQLERAAGKRIPWKTLSLKEALFAPEKDTILCGSLHLCGEALAILKS